MVFNSRKKALSAVGKMLTLLFVPSSLKPPVKFDHVNEFKAELDCSTQFRADDGHETEKLPPAGVMFSAGRDGRTISNIVPPP